MTSASPPPSPADRHDPRPGLLLERGLADLGRGDDADDVIDLRTSRLAELVAGLTGCEPAGALHALRSGGEADSGDALELVARAMVDVDQPPPERFRVAGFLRLDLPLAHHGSLRRWDHSEPKADESPTRRPRRSPPF